MNGAIKGKVPGSRRYRQVSADKRILRERDEFGAIVPNDNQVGIDFLCKRDGSLLGQVRMSTMPNNDREVFMLKRKDGTLPEEAGRPADQGKVLLLCDQCSTDRQISHSAIKDALDKLWEPNKRRVVALKV